ncbi:MerR family transcriptional regulator [Alkalicoccobacillus murimartini]|uniref:DNA-binding transcriptional MerR regulator n=1 Tax=Alkalicoccobacillus murimartini TaxID=171685 RepID=A0ABT9YMF3_9BACI|nr:MerR family transcriptional regulator [Alkalicoccobacillus murimartini]MDQ0208681.1 DNA-binding transcriptional MerR regulator [Alkalicoccobacillus murimartini]
MDLQHHLTTGQFAKIMNVSKDTLLHYDKMGLFSPEIKQDNGYRYYLINQLDVFNIILALKELDMPLKEIKEYIVNRSPEELIDLLQEQETYLDNKIKQLQLMKKVLSDMKNNTKHAIKVDTSEIKEEHQTSEYLLLTKAHPSIEDNEIYQSILDHKNALNEQNITAYLSAGWMFDSTRIKNKVGFYYDYLFSRVDREKTTYNYIKQEGTYLIAYHTSGYSRIEDTHERLVRYAKKQDMDVIGYFYEDILLDELTVRGYERYLIKVSIMIR